MKIQNGYSKLSNEQLLKKVSSGKLNRSEARAAALVLERRFPTPPAIKLGKAA